MSGYDKIYKLDDMVQGNVSGTDTCIKTADIETEICRDGIISLIQVKVKNNKLKKWNVVRRYNCKFSCDEVTKRLIKIHCDMED